MKKEDEIIQTLGQHGKQLENHGKQLDLLAKKANEHDKKFDIIESKLDNHDKRFDKLENKVDGLEKNILSALDENTNLLREVKEEQSATSNAVIRHDKKIERLEQVTGIAE